MGQTQTHDGTLGVFGNIVVHVWWITNDTYPTKQTSATHLVDYAANANNKYLSQPKVHIPDSHVNFAYRIFPATSLAGERP